MVNNKTTLMAYGDFPQGSPLPYSVLSTQFINAAYPDKKLQIRNGGFGSDAAAHPSNPNQFYVLTDRGPNADFEGCLGSGKLFLLPDYTPRIGLFELQANGDILKIKEILLKNTQGTAISGLPNPKALGGTHEIPYDVDGQLMTMNPSLPFDEITNPIKTDINGLDPEGLAALTDGSFWISDEYGPHLVHYNGDGVEIGRINPFATDARNTVVAHGQTILLPAEFAKRRANRGMESLTITPDQTTLVGVMESSLDNPDTSGRASNLARIVTINLVSGQIAQYLYPLNHPKHVTSGIAALSNHEFYLIEHDRKLPLQEASAQKHIYKINIAEATDIESITDKNSSDTNATDKNSTEKYHLKQDSALGLTINGQALEPFIASSEGSWQTLATMNIIPVDKKLVVDVLKTVDYPHDKLEGLWLRQDGSLGLLNDDDFAMTDAMTDLSMTAVHLSALSHPNNPNNLSTLNNLVEQKYLDRHKTIEDANRLYIVMPTE